MNFQILTFICLVEYAKVNVYIRDHKFREQQIEIARKKYDMLIEAEEAQVRAQAEISYRMRIISGRP